MPATGTASQSGDRASGTVFCGGGAKTVDIEQTMMNSEINPV